MLKVEGRAAPLPLAASRGVKLDGTVATVQMKNAECRMMKPDRQGFARARHSSFLILPSSFHLAGALVDERGNVVGVVSAKLSASAALRATSTLPENVNYAVKSSYLLSFLESVPEVSAKLKEVFADGHQRKFEEVVKSAEQAAVLVLVLVY